MSRNSPYLLAILFGGCLLLSGCGSNPAPAVQSAIPYSSTAFDFGATALSQSVTRSVFNVTNTGTASATLTVALSGDTSLSLRPGFACGPALAPGGECSLVVDFAPKEVAPVSGVLTATLSGAGGATGYEVQLSGSGVQLSGGGSLITPTANPLVANYTFQPTGQGTVAVEFGLDTNYGQKTAAVPTSSNGGPVSLLVAGMKQNTTYHLRATLTAADGTVTEDVDHSFTTGAFPSAILPTLTATTASGQTPQPGIELADATLSATSTNYLQAYASDLAGNLIWGYNFPDRPTANTIIQPIKLLPNGNLLLVLSFASQFVLPGQGVTLSGADESVDLIREIDLAGDPVAQITLATLNAKLAAAGYTFTLTDLHHDVTMLPNGHLVVIANTLRTISNLTGYSAPTSVLGDVLVDLDANFNVAWVWSEFDHLDVNRHPIAFPDWTHTNAVVYSPNDGDLLVSMRHQSWIIKVDYNNGAGTGNVLWRLGNGGDFTLVNGTAPGDWFYGQHDPAFVGSATSGQFSLVMMDNGYGRYLSDGTQCGVTAGADCYTTVPILALDEAAKTATVSFRQTLDPSLFSVWGGSASVLANGDLEYDLCAEPSGIGSEVDEVTTSGTPQPVWSLKVTGGNLYRAHRLPSLYPGVQW